MSYYAESLALTTSPNEVQHYAYPTIELGYKFDQTTLISSPAQLAARLGLAHPVISLVPVHRSLTSFAKLNMARGYLAKAARLFGSAHCLRQAVGLSIPALEDADNETCLGGIRSALGEAAFNASWAEGCELTTQQAIDEAKQVALIAPPGQAPAAPAACYPAGLTAREVEVLRLVGSGLTDAQVAERLVISPRTVNSHLYSIYSKLDVTTRTGAVRYASENRLI
jgi:DNA-binding CsgD family transcriptional regulator